MNSKRWDTERMGLILRHPTPDDTPGVIALVEGVYHEYGDRVCLEDAERDLLSFHDHFPRLGGDAIVLVDGEQVVGMHAVVPLADQPGVCTFRRLYMAPSLRGSGWGEKLMQWAIDTAKAKGFHRIEFWSDTRFVRAHHFFARLEFKQDGRVRDMTDSYQPYQEYFFFRDL